MTSSELMTATVSEMLRLVTWFSLITCTAFVYADEPSQYFNFPLSSTENVHTQADDQSPQRLQNVKPSMLYHLSPNFDRGDSASLDGALADGIDASKRVFCNGFTGCGSFRRGSRRRPKTAVGKRLQDRQAISKKPFCNSHGCFNSGKRSGEMSSEDVPQVGRVRFSDDEFPSLRTKRLFCNGYGGCQNMGKRLLLLEKLRDQSRQWDGESADALDKRYWTGGFDEEADSLVDSMSR